MSFQKPVPKIGQRWLWEDSYSSAVGEIIDLSYSSPRMKVIQIKKGTSLDGWGLGQTFSASLELTKWYYLIGQDNPNTK